MKHTGVSRRLRMIESVAVAGGLLGSLLVWNVPAQAVNGKGLNGLIVCGGTEPTSNPHVADFNVYVMNPDGSNRRNVTADNPITDYNPLWTPDGTQIWSSPSVRTSRRRHLRALPDQPGRERQVPAVRQRHARGHRQELPPGRIADRVLQQP